MRRLLIGVAAVLAGVGGGGVSLAAAPAGAGRQPETVMAFTPEAIAMLGVDPTDPDAPVASPAALVAAEPVPVAMATETITVTVQAGPLLLIDPPGTIQLRRVGDSSRFEATVTGLRLADARGSYAGWELRMQLLRLNGRAHEDGELHIVVSRVDAFADTFDGITAAEPTDLGPDESVVLVEAAPGSGGGSWDVTLDVSAELPDVRAQVVTAQVRFSAV